MSKALIIKDVDFSVNKLATISFSDSKPCTGISLNHSTYSLTSIGATVTLEATLTPSDTTDELSWATSDSGVATVSNSGVVTAVGVGTATITATCGNQSATCTITAIATLSYSYVLSEKNTKASGDRDYGEVNPAATAYAALYSTTQADRKVRKASSSTIPETNIYPIMIPDNATQIIATLPNTLKLTMWFLDTGSPAEYNSGQYASFAKVISGDASEYSSSIANGDRTVNIPEGANSAIFTIWKGANETMSAEDVASVTIKAG